jgi:hypothetical protein
VTLAVQTVPSGDYSLSVSPSNQAIAPGSSGTYTININRANGFAGTVTFTVAGLRHGATYTLPASSGASSTLTVSVAASDPGDAYSFTITGSSTGLPDRSTMASIDTRD